MRVKNIKGTSDNQCPCGTWRKHWVNFSSTSWPTLCPVIGCGNPAEVGAHVQRADIIDQSWYIIPLCRPHNVKNTGPISVSEVELVSANISQTCG